MGEADANSLVRELLAAVRDGAYDDFVAKGSAAFRAAAPADLFGKASTLRKRLAGGYRASLLGNLRHDGARVWLYRLEFNDGGDDALTHLRIAGWQVAGFFIEDPQSAEQDKQKEK